MASNRDASIYLKSNDAATHKAVGEILLVLQGGKGRRQPRDMRDNIDRLKELSQSISPNGAALFQALFDEIDNDAPQETCLGIQGGGRRNAAGYWGIVINFGWSGQEISEALVNYFGQLMGDGGDARAYIESNGADWFCRFQDGKAKSEYYSDPFENRAKDDEALESGVYAWWHEELPDKIREGELNTPNAEEIYREIAGEEESPSGGNEQSIMDPSKLPTPYRELAETLCAGDVAGIFLSITATELHGRPILDYVPEDLPRDGHTFGEHEDDDVFGFCAFLNESRHANFNVTATKLRDDTSLNWPTLENLSEHLAGLGIDFEDQGIRKTFHYWSWLVGDFLFNVTHQEEDEEGITRVFIEIYPGG